jgi:hypothetical protein
MTLENSRLPDNIGASDLVGCREGPVAVQLGQRTTLRVTMLVSTCRCFEHDEKRVSWSLPSRYTNRVTGSPTLIKAHGILQHSSFEARTLRRSQATISRLTGRGPCAILVRSPSARVSKIGQSHVYRFCKVGPCGKHAG